MNLLIILLATSGLIGGYFSMNGLWYEFFPGIMFLSACIVAIGKKQLLKIVLVFNLIFGYYIVHSSYLVFNFSDHFWKYAPFIKTIEVTLYFVILFLTVRLIIRNEPDIKIWPIKVRLGILAIILAIFLLGVMGR